MTTNESGFQSGPKTTTPTNTSPTNLFDYFEPDPIPPSNNVKGINGYRRITNLLLDYYIFARQL